MERPLLPENAANGGFPEPQGGGAVRVVSARHDACGAATRVRLPSTVPARAVRRLYCPACEQGFEPAKVAEVAGATPKRRLPPLPRLDPQGRGWKLVSIPIAGVAVIGGLLVLRGDGEAPPPAAAKAKTASRAAAGTGAGERRNAERRADRKGGGNSAKISKDAKLVAESSFSLALPAGWERIEPPAGATFAAVAADGGADATLWITEDPKLDFPTFIAQSLTQLETLAGSARIVERVPAPTADATIVRLAADAPAGQPSYEVTLRVSGAYRYYLASSVQPDASRRATEGAELVAGSFTPAAEAGG